MRRSAPGEGRAYASGQGYLRRRADSGEINDVRCFFAGALPLRCRATLILDADFLGFRLLCLSAEWPPCLLKRCAFLSADKAAFPARFMSHGHGLLIRSA